MTRCTWIYPESFSAYPQQRLQRILGGLLSLVYLLESQDAYLAKA
jgi:hypothetical protein